jgi:hypothetical protein
MFCSLFLCGGGFFWGGIGWVVALGFFQIMPPSITFGLLITLQPAGIGLACIYIMIQINSLIVVVVPVGSAISKVVVPFLRNQTSFDFPLENQKKQIYKTVTSFCNSCSCNTCDGITFGKGCWL